MTFDTLFAKPNGRTDRGQFIAALIVLLAVLAFYHYIVLGRTGQWCQLVLLIPAIILHARRFRDMGMTPWVLLVPAALNIAVGWIYLYNPGSGAKDMVAWAAIIVSALFILWGLIGKSKGAISQAG